MFVRASVRHAGGSDSPSDGCSRLGEGSGCAGRRGSWSIWDSSSERGIRRLDDQQIQSPSDTASPAFSVGIGRGKCSARPAHPLSGWPQWSNQRPHCLRSATRFGLPRGGYDERKEPPQQQRSEKIPHWTPSVDVGERRVDERQSPQPAANDSLSIKHLPLKGSLYV